MQTLKLKEIAILAGFAIAVAIMAYYGIFAY